MTKTDLGMEDQGGPHWHVKMTLGITQLRLLQKSVCFYRQLTEEGNQRLIDEGKAPDIPMDTTELDNLKSILDATILEHTFSTDDPKFDDPVT